MQEWSQIVPAFLSFWLPGMGQAYNGQTQKARSALVVFGLIATFFFPLMHVLPDWAGNALAVGIKPAISLIQVYLAYDAWKSARGTLPPGRSRLIACAAQLLLLLLLLLWIEIQRHSFAVANG